MHRNAEIWEKRNETMEAISRRMTRHFQQAEAGARDHDELDAVIQRREDWYKRRYAPLAKRVWHDLCVAKGWRMA